MRPSLVTARWLYRSNSHRFCQLPQRRPVGRSSVLSQPAAKCAFATLGFSPSRARRVELVSDKGLCPSSNIPSIRSYRFAPAKASKPSVPARAETGRNQANPSAPSDRIKPSAVQTLGSPPVSSRIPDPTSTLDANEEAALLALQGTTTQLLAGSNIPGEQAVLSALAECKEFASLHKGKSTRPGLKSQQPESVTSASSLLSLDGALTKRSKATATPVADTKGLINVNDDVSRIAFDIVSHPAVVITPQILDAYVDIQSLLGDPETLPYVLDLYASKPKPQGGAGSVRYVKRNPNRANNAINPTIAEKALDIAIEARNLDAAVGIVAHTYGTTAFTRQKLLRKAMAPAVAVAGLPFAVYIVASRLAKFQHLYDDRTATAMAALGLCVYVGSTAFMGFLAIFTANDQMNRVTWAPGIRLLPRWLREEERAGLDKVACAFGFSEANRHGEEEGVDFESLRRYILLRGMVLDRVESMPGMK